MFSVALIGPDGAGKTTIAQRLERLCPVAVRYLYMGTDIAASNIALPWSRWRERRRKCTLPTTAEVHAHPGHLRSLVALINRIAEELYRLLVSWYYRKRGWVVVYDRYFPFEYAYDQACFHSRRFTDSIHRWWIAHACRMPDLVVLLDAPAEVLLARKHEGPLERLEELRWNYVRMAAKAPHWMRVDATQPLDMVCHEISRSIIIKLHLTEARRGVRAGHVN